MPLTLASPAFSQQGGIPTQYTCEGEDISPPLSWSDVPEGTRSFTLIVDDPDAPDPKAPRMTWVHWVLYNLPAMARALPDRRARVSAQQCIANIARANVCWWPSIRYGTAFRPTSSPLRAQQA